MTSRIAKILIAAMCVFFPAAGAGAGAGARSATETPSFRLTFGKRLFRRIRQVPISQTRAPALGASAQPFAKGAQPPSGAAWRHKSFERYGMRFITAVIAPATTAVSTTSTSEVANGPV